MEGKKLESTARTSPQSLTAPPAEYAVFRILCDLSQAGGRIGISGRVIHQLQESTKSRIWFEKAPLDSQYRVITILAHVGSKFRVNLGVTVNNASNREKEAQEQELVEISRAQYALIGVFEALNVGFRTSSSVSCRLLMEGIHVVTVIGKASELLERIRRETGSNVEIRTHDLPSCAKPDDVMVKIEGSVLAVKKALVSISSRLQACKPISMASLHKHTEAIPDALRRPMDVVPLPRDALNRYFGTITQPAGIDSLSQYRIYDHRFNTSASKNHPVTIKQPPLQESEDDIRNVVLKILCPKQSARACAVIKTLRSVRDASISVSDTLADCDERLITITASENLKDEDSPSQRAIFLVFKKLYDIPTGKMLDSAHKYTTARLVVGPYQVGFLLGKGGCTISEMRKKTGASLNILEVEKNPKCVSENDQVVEISGKLPQVKGAIYHVTEKLRSIATKRKVISTPEKRIYLVLKILCSRESAGKAGTILRDIRINTGASIFMGDILADCDERLITIIASEDPDDKNSPAQRALILVFTRIYEIATETKDFDVRSSITARLVVRTYKINCFVGRDGCIASMIQKGTGAKIEVLEVEQNPKCVPKNTDRVVQISGGFSNVKEAINQVTSRLRENLILHSLEPVDADPCIIPEDTSPNRVSPTALNFGRLSTMDLNDASHYSSQADPYGLWASRTPSAPRGVYDDGSGGLSSTKDDLGFYSGLRASNVTNKTVQYRVSENAVNSVFGDGHNGHTRLQDLGEISGARVILLESRLGTSERIISITGTPDQIQAAEDRLLALFCR